MASSQVSNGLQGPMSKVAPFPTKQLFILALVRICEPIAFMSIFPYVYYMIVSFDITSDNRQIAIYAGLVTSAFAFAEFSTGVLWGRLSDKIGRKPVLIGGLTGTALSMLMFGFSRNLPMALLGRALGGLLNGNIGVLQTTVAEMVTAKEHQPRAYSIMPFVWCLGSIIGPALGGALAQPCISYPNVFSRGSLFDTYPFLLPNLVCVVILACGALIGVLFLEETHSERKHQHDFGLQVGAWVMRHFKPAPRPTPILILDKAAEANLQEDYALLEEDLPPEYQTNENSPRHSSSLSEAPQPITEPLNETRTSKKSSGAKKAFTKQVVLLILSYGILAYHTMSFDQLMPVFLSSPATHGTVELPFKFTGGFELSTKTIGIMLSLAGAYSMVAQLFLFPYVVNRFGPLKTFRFVLMTWPLLYLIVPYLVLLPPSLQMPGAFLCLLWRTTNQTLSYPSSAILITNSAPSMMVLGLINGVAASSASLSRAFGPTISGIIHAWALKMGYVGISWWVSGLVCFLGALESLWLQEPKGRMDVEEKSEELDDDDDDEESFTDSYPDPTAIDAAIKAVAKA